MLLQCTNLIHRLQAEKLILSEAAEIISEKLVSIGVITAEKRDAIKTQSLLNDYDEDILPAEDSRISSADEPDEWDISNIE